MSGYLCECDDINCRDSIDLELEEMMFLRRTPGYVMLPGHQDNNDEVIGTDSDNRFVYVAEREDGRVAPPIPIVH